MKTKSLLLISILTCLLYASPCAAQESAEVDTPAMFRGGDIHTFNEWVFRKMIYLLDNNIDFGEEGTITVSFTVDKKGKIKDVTLVSAYDEQLANKVVSAIKKAPAWSPAIINGSPADVVMTADIQLYKHRIYLPSKPIRVPSPEEERIRNELMLENERIMNELSPEQRDSIRKIAASSQHMPVFSKGCRNNQKADQGAVMSWAVAQIQSRNLSGIDGQVELEFIINKSGYVEEVVVIKTTNPRLSRVAIDIMYSCPKWYSPGISDGKPVRVKYMLPIRVMQSSSFPMYVR